MFTVEQLKKIEATFLIVRGCVISVGKEEAEDCIEAFVNLKIWEASQENFKDLGMLGAEIEKVKHSLSPSYIELKSGLVDGHSLSQFVYAIEDYYQSIQNADEAFNGIELSGFGLDASEIPDIEDILNPLAKIFARSAGLI